MITATLCTTNSSEPWGANVEFKLEESKLSTTLATKYTHIHNLQTNPDAVIVYSKDNLELIIKNKARLGVEKDGKSKAIFTIY